MALAGRVQRPFGRAAPRNVTSVSMRPQRVRSGANVRSTAAQAAKLPDAILFDCDGVLVDTEKDGHRVAFNEAFKRMGEQPACALGLPTTLL